MSKLRKFKVRVAFVTRGHFEVAAKNRAEAVEHVSRHCGMVLKMGCIHSSLPDELVGWDFPAHPEKKVLRT